MADLIDSAGLFEGQTAIQMPLTLPALMAIPNHRGVFLLEGEAGAPILLATAASIRSRMRFRLTAPQEQQPSKRVDLREISRLVRWKLCDSHFETDWRYWQIARQLYPQTYADLLGFGLPWFVQVRMEGPIPWLYRAHKLPDRPDECFGPFPTGRAAQRYMDLLRDAFDLCRSEDLLRQAPNAKPCAYKQMGRCQGPCDGSISVEQYRRIVQDACRFAAGDHQAVRARMRQEMRDLAGRQLYEQAAAHKVHLDRLGELEKPDFAHVSPLERFQFVLIHHGPSFHQAKSFLVDRGHVQAGPVLDFPPSAEQLGSTLAALTALATQHLPAGQEQWEAAGLVSHYLFSPPDKQGLVLRYGPSLSVEQMAGAIVEHAQVLDLRAPKPRGKPRPAAGAAQEAKPPGQGDRP